MKRQRSRNRSGGGNNKPQQNANRAFESNGPDGVKIRGAAQHVYEKYQQLARDALTSGDRVLGESYQQHAEHYFRVLRAMQPQRPASDIIGRDAFASGFDIDFEDDASEGDSGGGDNNDGAETNDRSEWRGDNNGANNNNNNRYEGRRDERPRDDRPRDEGRRDERTRDEQRNRDDRPRDDRQRDDRPRERNFNRDDRPRDDQRPRDDRPRNDRYRDDRPREDRAARDDRPAREDRPQSERRFERVDPMAVVEPQASPLTTSAEPAASSPMLRSHDGEVSHAPAFLQARSEARPVEQTPETPSDEARPPRARRRRAPRSFEAAEGEGGAADDA